MEINEKKLVQILKEQRTEFQRYSDSQFRIIDKKFQRYLGVVAEDFASKFNLLAESISGVQEQLIALRDMVAKNTEDIEIIKMDISFMKHELKQKVDQDEFGVLEKRVLLLEKKLARA